MSQGSVPVHMCSCARHSLALSHCIAACVRARARPLVCLYGTCTLNILFRVRAI